MGDDPQAQGANMIPNLATLSNLGWTEFASDAAMALALTCCAGSYQLDLINGGESWSGSTLKGSAKKYGGKYNTSRNKLISKMQEAGLRIVITPMIGQRHNTAIVW